jgi:phosphatidylserine/phosphatidylglycerophosphate/cardiolipin synthase-like enzyme
MTGYELVYNRNGSRKVLMEAMLTAKYRLIIVCPWITSHGIADIIALLENKLNKGVNISIGWGNLDDYFEICKENLPCQKSIRKQMIDKFSWKYTGLKKLEYLETIYQDKLELKLLGTHEKFLVCDNKFAMLGSHNLLTSSKRSTNREVGLRTTDNNIIQELIELFDNSFCYDKKIIPKEIHPSYSNAIINAFPGDPAGSDLIFF